MPLSRRQCLLLAAPLFGGGRRLLANEGQGLGGFVTNAGPPCGPDDQVTPAVPADATYKKGAPVRTTLVEPGMAGTPLTLSGTVSGVSCGRIKGATVDAWQADASGAYDTAGFRLRGRQLTDAEGRFKIETIVPGHAAGRARHIGLHVNVPGKADFWTEVFFPDDPQNASDARFKKELAMKMVQAPKGRQAGLFDVVLKL
jgi:protocatechuate 3,4-dioxygenase beta subunit